MAKFKWITMTPRDFIEHLLFYENSNYPIARECPLSFYIHATLINKLVKRMDETFPKDDWEMFEQKLQVGTKCFDMYLIIILRGSKEHLDIWKDLIQLDLSQFSFPLEETPTLYMEASSFNIMEEFIRKNKLEPYILKTEEMVGISAEVVTIKVVTFKNMCIKKFGIFTKFHSILRSSDLNRPKFYFTIFSFPWQQTPILRKGRINDRLCFVFPIILKHLGTINYKNELNIMDLVSLRLAICDDRDQSQATSFIKLEIDFLIKRELAKTVKDKHFDLKQYLIAKNCKEYPLLCNYLIYEFQHCFETLNVNILFRDLRQVDDSIKLRDDSDGVLNKIKDKFNIDYKIDGIGFDRMSTSLFFGLIECPNVSRIELDTSYEWIKDAPNLNRIVAGGDKNAIFLTLHGENNFKFAEDCIADLKRLEFHQIHLDLNCSLDDYRILDDLHVKDINFIGIRIVADMLKNMHQYNIKSPLRLFSCTIENSWQTWELLNNLEGLQTVGIHEDEGTWLSIFEFVTNELKKTNSNDFQFKISQMSIMSIGSGTVIDLNSIKFTFDDQVSKLEVRDRESNELEDLFNRKFYVKSCEKSDFEFYQ